MKRNSLIMIVVGILILAGIWYFLNGKKSNTPAQTSSQTQTEVTQQENQPIAVIVDYNSTDKSFEPKTTQVPEGSQVVLKVTSDIADELHFHGYDLHTDLESGKEGDISFTADKTGRFEFELEDHATTLGVIEVLPR